MSESPGFSKYDPREPRPVGDGESQYYIGDIWPKGLGKQNSQDNLRNRKEYVCSSHDEFAEPVFGVSGNEAEGNPKQQGGPDSDDGDNEGHPGSEKKAAENIPPHTVSSQQVLRRGRLKPCRWMDTENIFWMGSQNTRKNGHHDEEKDNGKARKGQPIPGEF